ncbi:MAG TPA: hypothetical protein VE623_19185 [Acidimicrobiales bacterium]|nr:hypothetical protein [Acidimicrobiales bacterium]
MFDELAPRRRPAERLVRPILLLLALAALQVGLWLVISPRSFYDDFRGFGRTWVSVDGPYNEHAFRDFGDSQLAIAVVLLAAFLRPQRYLVRTAALVYLLFAVPHLLYHATELDVYDNGDQVAITVSLGISVVLSCDPPPWCSRRARDRQVRSAVAEAVGIDLTGSVRDRSGRQHLLLVTLVRPGRASRLVHSGSPL